MSTSIDTLKDTLNALGETFHEFKIANDQRLQDLERKHHDPLVVDKVERINHALTDLEKKMHNLTVSRPMMDTSVNAGNCEVKTAFLEYLRTGSLPQHLEQKDFSTGNNEGGVLIPQAVIAEVRDRLVEPSLMRELATVQQVQGSREYIVPVSWNAPDMAWGSEKGPNDPTKTPEIRKVTIPLHLLYARPLATHEVLSHSRLEEWLYDTVYKTQAQHENEAFINGDGKNKPKGILSETKVGKGSWKSGSETLETFVTGADGELGADPQSLLFDMYHALRSGYHKNAAWVASPSVMAAIRKLKEPSYGYYLWQPPLGASVKPSLLGLPVHMLESMPPLVSGSSSSPLMLGDFKSGYTVVTGDNDRILRDPLSKKPLIEFYFEFHIGGAVINHDAIKVLSCAKA